MSAMKPAQRRYSIHLAIAFLAYALILVTVNTYLKNSDAGLMLSAALVLLPVLPVLFIIRIILQYVRSWDELQQKKYLEAVVIAFAVVGTGTFAWGFLEGIGFPPLKTIWILPLMMVTLPAAHSYVCWRYR